MNILHLRTHVLLGLLLLLTATAACDSGDIAGQDYTVSESGKTVRLRMTVSGAGRLEEDLCLALAAYADDEKYATVQRVIPTATPDGTQVELILGNLGDHIHTVALVLAGRLRDRILTLADIDLTACVDGDTLTTDLGPLTLDLYGCIQTGILDQTCIQCHSTIHQAARLNLSEGYSMEQLVGVPSTVRPHLLRVSPGQPQESLLHQVVAEDGSQAVGFNHTDLMSSQFKSNLPEVRWLIDRWITSLEK